MRWRNYFYTVLCTNVLIFSFSNAQSSELSSLIYESISTHPSISSQNALLKSAELDVESAKWNYFPTPSLSVNYAPESTDPAASGDPVTILGLEQPIWTWGKIDAGVERAVAMRDLNSAAVGVAREDIALRVVQIYSDGYAAHMKLRAVSESEVYHRLLVAQIERRIKEGISPAVDRSLATNRLEQILADKSMLDAQRESSLSRISQLVGRKVDSDIYEPAADALPIDTRNLELLKKQASQINSHLLRAQANADALKASVKEVKASTLPKLTLRLEQQLGNDFSSGTDSSSRILLAIRSDFGAGFSKFSNTASAEERSRSADEELEVTRRSLYEQLDNDRLLLISLENRKESLIKAIETYTSIKESYKRQYLEGSRSWLDIMNAEREHLELLNKLSDIIAANIATSWRLAILTQGPYASKKSLEL